MPTTAPVAASAAAPTVAVPARTASRRSARRSTWLTPYLDLTKFRLSMLVLWTAATGFAVAAFSTPGPHALTFIFAMLGTAMAAGCANAFNQIMEAGRDAQMDRTRSRPIPSGRLSHRRAAAVATVLGVGGTLILALLVNVLAASLALATILLYIGVYTPLKTRSTLNTLVGAVVGAIPPMIGWAAAAGRLDGGAWILAGILFMWQLPHFLALAWLYRDDYAKGGYVMLPVIDGDGRLTCRVIVMTTLMMVPVCLSATLLGLGGTFYTLGVLALGVWTLHLSLKLHRDRSRDNARSVFLASLVSLPAVMLLLVLNYGPIGG